MLLEGCMREFGDVAAEFLEYAHRHRTIIKRFGRFPHRNEALGARRRRKRRSS